ncbi:hypothetical protein F4810DRAFT_709497 [Camillea tinctor]|nr:hypothetical protein F4810DRAFT_709497 [Camillea tinctor]
MKIDLEDFYFSFGPDGSYWFDGPKCCEYAGIPSTWPPSTRHPVHRLRSLAMGRHGERFMRFRDARGRTYTDVSPSLCARHPPLAAHLHASRSRGPSLAFGPDGHGAIAWDDDTVYPHAVPAASAAGRVLCREILGLESLSTLSYASPPPPPAYSSGFHSSPCSRPPPPPYPGPGVVGGDPGAVAAERGAGAWRDRPRLKHAALGAGWACFFLAADGRWWFDGAGCYATLERVLAGLRMGDVRFLALNPYRVDEFFLLLADHTALFRVPLSARRALERALRRHGVAAPAFRSADLPFSIPPAFPAGALHPSAENGAWAHGGGAVLCKPRKRKHWKKFASMAAAQVTGQVAGAVVTTVASALVGSAACCVM